MMYAESKLIKWTEETPQDGYHGYFRNQHPDKAKWLYEQKWLIFMNPYPPMMRHFNRDEYLVSNLKDLERSIQYHKQFRDKFEGNCAYEAAEFHQQKINDAEWLVFQMCDQSDGYWYNAEF